jgi:oligosaccharide repeat unit polymerase
MITQATRGNGPLLIVQCLCLCAGFTILMIMPFSLINLGTERTLLWIVGVAALLILTAPFLLHREFDLFEPMSFVMLIVLFGITLRAIYIAVYDNDTISNELLLGRDRGFLLAGGIIILLSLIALVSGYMVQMPIFNIRRFRLFRKERWSTPRLFLVVFLFALIGVIAMLMYLRKMGIASFALSNLSTKHFYVVEGAEYQSSALGYYRWAASLIVPAFYLYLSWFAVSGRRWVSLWGVGVVILGLLAAVFPFINSSRSGIIEILIFAIVLWHYLRRRIRVRMLVWAFAFFVMLFILMGVLRAGKVRNIDDLSSRISMEMILDRLVGNRNLFGIDKTGHIINAVPDKLSYKYGGSLLSIFFAPIPRTMWLSKPPVNLGATIAETVYDRVKEVDKGSGISPGFVPELYLNFSVPGVLIGMFILGIWLKFLYKSFKLHIGNNRNAAIVYIVIMYGFSFDILGSEFTSALIGVLRLLIPLVTALWFIGKYLRYRPTFG